MKDLTLGAESQGTTIYGATVSDLQGSDVKVENGKVTGTLKYFDTPGAIVDVWGEGHFFAFKISGEDTNTTKTMVGLEPSEGSGPVDIHGDPDMNGIAKITDITKQEFRVVQSDAAGHKNIQVFDLSGLTLEPKEE